MLTIKIEVNTREIALSSSLIPVALSKRNTFKYQFQQAIENQKKSYARKTVLHVDELTMRRMIEKYSEQVVYRPIDDMRYYFQYTKRAMTEPGYPPLFYPAVVDRKRDPNISAVMAIGEGVAGLVAQKLYQCRKLARPYKDGVDIVMSTQHQTYLVEAKGSAAVEENSFVSGKLNDEYLEDVSRETLSSSEIDIRLVKGLLIGVHLKNEISYNCYITEINIS